MACCNNNISTVKIHEQCMVAPPPPPPPPPHAAASHFSLPLTFFDLIWLKIHPVEYVFFYNLHSQHPSFFFDQVVPKLKTSLSHTLQHFPPLAGSIVWPSDSDKPFVKYNPGDGVSLVIAESDADFNTISNNNSAREASESRSFLPHLESSDSRASIVSLQITLFPKSGFSIGISAHHLVFDGKSTTMFIKAWASLCQSVGGEEHYSPLTSSLVPELVPFFDRGVIKDPNDIWVSLPNINTRSVKLPLEPKLEDSVRATFVLTRGDLDKIKKRVLSKWDTVDNNNDDDDEKESINKPTTLSSFVLTCGYVLVCIAKAIQGVNEQRQKFAFGLVVDCRSRLEPPIPEKYFGNCVWGHFVDAKPGDFINEDDGVVIVAKSIHNKIKMLDMGIIEAVDPGFFRFGDLVSEGIEVMAMTGSNKFGVYGIDFGWGRPAKVIIFADRGLVFAMAENKDGNGGVEFGLVLKKHVMDLFIKLFHAGLCHE